MQLIDSVDVTPTENHFAQVMVNGIAISEEAILTEMQYHTAEKVEQAQQSAARALVVKELMLQRADELGIEAQAQAGESNDEAMIRVLLEQEIQRPEADAEACYRYFSANPDKFKSPTIMAASHILLAADPRDPSEREQAKTQAEALVKKLQANPDQFAPLAQQHSACPSKDMQGSLGQITKGSTVPEFERQVLALPKGLAMIPIESRYGYHIVRVDQRIDGTPLPYDQVADAIASYLRDRVYHQAISQYVALLAGAASIEGVDIQAAASPLVQ
ncbi:MAG: peptidylprolyl isomerase [Gammaproteobacteria bacterium]|jgi:peptidyl-prolyl cis-trans isomerase C|nr:peptidylprolyl isomerase [Gammaproteobacteria bacterium]